MNESATSSHAFSRLREFTQKKDRAAHWCELCFLALPGAHRHLLEGSTGQVVCACDACALRFENAIGGRFTLIPRGPRRVDAEAISDEAWNSLALPINLAFFVHDSKDDRVKAFYPSPAGVTESQLPVTGWDAVQLQEAERESIRPDVEAVLVNRLNADHECFIVPIDVCYELAGLVRVHWRGLSGGSAVREHTDAFFQKLRARTA